MTKWSKPPEKPHKKIREHTSDPAPHSDQSTDFVDKLRPPTKAEGNTQSQSLYTLIAEQPFFKGLNVQQLQMLADSAMEMSFEPEQSILQEGSPANRFYLILEGKVVLESEMKERGRILIRTLGPGDDLSWSWLFPPHYLHFSARIRANQNDIFLRDSSAGAVRTRPRTWLSTHEASR